MWFELLIFAIPVTFLISVAWPASKGAPRFPTSMRNVHNMLKLADVGPNDVVYDLGCGDGRTIITAARKYGARAVGIEIDPFRYLWCQLLITILGLRSRVRIVRGNFFGEDLSEATLVTCYLLQETNNELMKKFHKELRPGTKLVSNTFTFHGIPQTGRIGPIRCYSIPSGADQTIVQLSST